MLLRNVTVCWRLPVGILPERKWVEDDLEAVCEEVKAELVKIERRRKSTGISLRGSFLEAETNDDENENEEDVVLAEGEARDGDISTIRVVGSPGIGKSWLALHVVNDTQVVSTWGQENIVWIDCGSSEENAVRHMYSFAQHLGKTKYTKQTEDGNAGMNLELSKVIGKVRKLLRKKAILFVLDDLHEDKGLVDQVLLGAPRCKALATMNETKISGPACFDLSRRGIVAKNDVDPLVDHFVADDLFCEFCALLRGFVTEEEIQDRFVLKEDKERIDMILSSPLVDKFEPGPLFRVAGGVFNRIVGKGGPIFPLYVRHALRNHQSLDSWNIWPAAKPENLDDALQQTIGATKTYDIQVEPSDLTQYVLKPCAGESQRQLAIPRPTFVSMRIDTIEQLEPHIMPEAQINTAIIVIAGMMGTGKSTMATQLLYDPAVYAAYKGNVHWINVGQDIDKKGIYARLFNLFRECGGKVPMRGYRKLSQLREATRDFIAGKRHLIVLDDVWEENVLRGFDIVDGVRNKLLVTSRNPNVAKRLDDSHTMYLDPIIDSDEDVLKMLKFHADFSAIPEERTTMLRIADSVERHPLALAMVGMRYQTFHAPQKSWADFESEFDPSDLFLHGESAHYHLSLQGSVEQSVSKLSRDMMKRYFDMAIFVKEGLLSVGDIRCLWGENEEECVEHIDTLLNASLLLRHRTFDDHQHGTYYLHTIHHQYICNNTVRASHRQQLKLSKIHARFVDNAAKLWGGNYNNAPRYTSDHLRIHMEKGGIMEQFASLLSTI